MAQDNNQNMHNGQNEIWTMMSNELDNRRLTQVKNHIARVSPNPQDLLYDDDEVKRLRNGLTQNEFDLLKQVINDLRYAYPICIDLRYSLFDMELFLVLLQQLLIYLVDILLLLLTRVNLSRVLSSSVYVNLLVVL